MGSLRCANAPRLHLPKELYRKPPVLMPRRPPVLMPRRPPVLMPRKPPVLMPRRPPVLMPRRPPVLMPRKPPVLMPRKPPVLMPRRPPVLMPRRPPVLMPRRPPVLMPRRPPVLMPRRPPVLIPRSSLCIAASALGICLLYEALIRFGMDIVLVPMYSVTEPAVASSRSPKFDEEVSIIVPPDMARPCTTSTASSWLRKYTRSAPPTYGELIPITIVAIDVPGSTISPAITM